MNNKIKQFGSFLQETSLQEEKKPYHLVIISHDDIHDTNETGVLIRDTGKKMGLKVDLLEFTGLFIEYKNGKTYLNSLKIDEDGDYEIPDVKTPAKYGKPVELTENTLLMIRGLGTSHLSGNPSWSNLIKILEKDYKVINSTLCHDICSDKHYNQIVFERENVRTPKTSRLSHPEDYEAAYERLNTEFPVILKTGHGSRGVGVILIESMKTLRAVCQLLNRESKFTDILLQEFIKNTYDVRVIVCQDEIVGVMKRPVAEGDFRSNVSQNSKPERLELTQKEKDECIRVTKIVHGSLVGVDFIPAKDREKDEPIFIEVNSTPGLIGIEENTKGVTYQSLLQFFDRSRW